MELQLSLDRSRRVPLAIQVAHGIRDALFAQQLTSGMKLPPTRELAHRLQVSRMVVVEAYEWLVSEGYAESRPGSGTYLTPLLNRMQQAPRRVQEPPRRTDPLPESSIAVNFRPGLPALDLFPRQAWKAALTRSLLEAEDAQMGYGPVEGLPRLRRVIAEYIARTRGLPVAPDRVVVTVGAAQAVDLMLRTLSPIGRMGIENPGAEPIHRLAHIYQIPVDAIPVDENGLRVERLRGGAKAPALVHTVPSHQYPTGWVMSLERRTQLLDWAENNRAFIMEDDYDSEFRFDRLPPIALAALDQSQRVVYIGTFSKTIFPGLRLGFCVLPERLINTFLDLKWFSDRCVPVIEQLALADWLESGVFERHIRKMRSVYAGRRAHLIAALNEQFGDAIEVLGVPAGMHLMLQVDLGLSEEELIVKAQNAGVKVYPTSVCYHGVSPQPPGIILGYGHLSKTAITQGVELLAKAWRCKPSAPYLNLF
jgi:GntR family transcriptional regulator / MocR family aminotransferase